MFSPDQAKAMSMVYMQSLGNELPTTQKMLAAVPDAQLEFKLGDNGRTARELMWHIVRSSEWFAEGIAGANFNIDGSEGDAPATTAEIVARFEKSLPALGEKIQALSGEQLAQQVSFFNVFHLPLVLYIDFWIKHTVHHRGQLSTYVRAMNAHVPSIYGGSFDEPFEMPATA
jgi:uncharacterized damage-inducible protein DinB